MKETYVISSDRYERAFERSKYGLGSNLDLLNAEIDLNTDLINLNNAEIDFKSIQNDFLNILGISDSSVVLDENVTFNNSLDLPELLKKQKVNNSSLLMADLNYNIAKQDLKISKSKKSPKIDLSTSISFNKSGSETSFISNQTDRSFFGLINIQFPIFNGNLVKNNIKNSKLNLQSKKLQLDEVRNQIELSIKNTFNEYKLGLKNLKIQKDNLEIFELNFNKSKELFLLGQLNSIQFREAQLNLINFKINYTANLYNTKIQEYLLYQYSGMLIIE